MEYIVLMSKSLTCHCKKVKLEVRKGNKIAISLYNRFGFSFHHSLSGYYADGEDALVLVLDLHTT